MSHEQKRKTVSIRLTVLGVFLIVAGLTAGLALGLQYHYSRDLAETAAQNSFRATSEKVGERIRHLDSQSAGLVGVLAHYHELATFPGPDRLRLALPLLGGAMENNPYLYAIYVGYDTGDFIELANLESGDNVRKAFDAAMIDRWVVISVTTVNGIREKTLTYLDDAFNVRIARKEATSYDPRKRPWFTNALASPGIIKTAPYFFSHLKAPGVTFATSVDQGQRVIAADISLAVMSEFLRKQRLLPQSQAFMFDGKGNITAQPSRQNAQSQREKKAGLDLSDAELAFISGNPVIRASNETDWPPFDFALSGKPKGYSVDMLNLLADMAGLRVEYVNGYSWEGLVELFRKGDLDLLHSLLRNAERENMGVFTRGYLPMPQAFAVKDGTPLPASITELAGKTVAIPKGWSTDFYLKEYHPEVKRLQVDSTLAAMRAVSAGEACATLDSEPVLRYLAEAYFLDGLRIGGHPPELNGRGDQNLHFLVRPEKAPLASILDKALAMVTPEERARLDAKWFGDDTADADMEARGTVPHPQLLELAKTAGPEGDLRLMDIKGRPYFGYVARIESIYGLDEFLGLLVPVKEILKPYMKKVHYSLLMTLGLLLFLTPVVWYCATIIVRPINALALESEKVKQRRYDDVRAVPSNITEIIGLSRSMVAMASAIKEYEESQRELMDSFIKLIATAIDQKSPYTGGHCARVPELSIMLAKAATRCIHGPFADFAFTTDDEWREFRTAAWVHDCGKVTTPEYIVDKATKLETIYNRIHEVRMRFEVLLRDAEIAYWRGLASDGDQASLARTRDAARREIVDEFAFIAECNLGGEFMSEDKEERIKKIAGKTWMRHLDDRLGLGHLELLRYPGHAPQLPCEEPLLADRPEHIIERPRQQTLGEEKSRFNLEVPEHLYNLGEIYNLCISKGTLTTEDRYKINEHIVTTIRMLETLPYPENMARIPEYAGAHHETLAGTGYPRKLIANDIGIPARIMAIADVFEALTASDRPYKKAKKLSEAVRILSFMVKDKHLDADLFRLFLKSGVYLEYARQFLDPSQIDAVDVETYLNNV